MNNILVREINKHKISFLVAVVFLIQWLFQDQIIESFGWEFPARRDCYLIQGLTGVLFFYSYIVEQISSKTMSRFIGFAVSSLLLTLAYWYWTHAYDNYYVFIQIPILLGFLILIGGAKTLSNDNEIWRWQNDLGRAGMESMLIAILTCVLSLLAKYLVEFVFEINSPDWVMPALMKTTVFFVPFVAFLVRMPTSREPDSKFVRMLLIFLVVPLWLFYVALLNIYLLKILFQWCLPRGAVVVPVTIAFGMYVLVWWGLKHLQASTKSGWPQASLLRVVKWMHVPLLALIFVSIARRVNDYGLTQPRYFVVLLAILFSVILGLDYAKRLNGRNLALAFLAACLLSFVPI